MVNWYKIAIPLVDDSSTGYMGIGHKSYDNAILWFINKDFEIFSTDVTENLDGHGGWDLFDVANVYDEILAQGRYEKRTHSLSLVLVQIKFLTETRKRYAMKRIEKIAAKH